MGGRGAQGGVLLWLSPFMTAVAYDVMYSTVTAASVACGSTCVLHACADRACLGMHVCMWGGRCVYACVSVHVRCVRGDWYGISNQH